MTQSPRDRVLWILNERGGKMTRNRLRVVTGLRYEDLNPILDELVREGRVKITKDKDRDLISLGIAR